QRTPLGAPVLVIGPVPICQGHPFRRQVPVETQPDVYEYPAHLRAASMVAMSIFCIDIIASNARADSRPPAASASITARGVICHESPQRSLHQPHMLGRPPLPTIAFQ